MYKRILLALDTTAADKRLVAHVIRLAQEQKSDDLLLLHVADGWAARHFDELQLAESEEMRQDRAYLEKLAEEFRAAGLNARIHLALGEPPAEIVKVSADEHCDLIVMTSHGHRLLADVVLGSTIEHVRHHTHVPLLVVPPE